MSSEVAENLREVASNLLAIANRLDGIDVTADAMRSGTVYVPPGYEIGAGDGGGQVLRCLRCSGWERPIFGAPGDLHAWVRLHDDFRHSVRSGTATPEQAQAYLDDLLRTHRPDLAPVPPEPEAVSVKVMTGRGFGVYVHRDPIEPLQIGDCTWPDGPCDGHRTGLGGFPLLTVPDDQAVHVPHRHANSNRACSEIICHATHGRPCRFCGGAPCRIAPAERGA